MTTEQDNQRVSDAYRDIATQTTPADLDEKVLQLAASPVPSRYGMARAWVRPLAWAATIALSLALVLEIGRFDEAPTPALINESRDQRVEPEPLERTDADLMKAKEEKDAQHGIAAKRAPENTPVPAAVDAEDMAVQQREADEPAAAASRARTSLSYFAPPDEEGHCDAEMRAAAENWFACIEALREEGLTDAADSELEALREAFPDFEEGRE
jgi:hypothetical protein